MDTNTKSQFNFLFKPIGLFSLIIILFLIVLFTGIKQINIIRSKIAAGNKTEISLNYKAGTLESVSQTLPKDVTFLDVILPSKGSVLYGLSQVKNQALVSGVTVSNLKTGSSVEDSIGVFKTSIIFDTEGEEQNIYKFLNSFSRLLPLMNVEKVSLTNLQDNTLANVSLSVYSAKLPTKIPAITESITELSSQEIKTLEELSGYEMPDFVEPSANILTEPKSDPFN